MGEREGLQVAKREGIKREGAKDRVLLYGGERGPPSGMGWLRLVGSLKL